jgi:flavin reductase (DIM6/NTAB) family NADH-FMN oxidoreductase RutF
MVDKNRIAVIDSALRLLDRELWVVTAADGERRGGLLATWVSPASIDRERPVLLAALAPNHFTAELVLASKAFAAHLLRPDQVELAWNFANGSGRSRDKLAGLEIEHRVTGSPVLVDSLAWFDCRVFAQYDAGDRLFLWGEVVDGELQLTADGTRSVTATCLREQAFFSCLTSDQRQKLAADREADAALNRPLFDEWRKAQSG